MNQPGFWKRQFSGEASRGQIVTDILLGMLLPLICLLLDPVVFKGRDEVLAKYRWPAYVFLGTEIVALALQLLLRRRPATRAVLFPGTLFAGGLFALALGLRMLPLTLAGMTLMFGVAVLGLSPFFTAFVYFRNAVRAWSQSRQPLSPTAPR